MSRPHDENGAVLPPAHTRLAESVAVQQAIVFHMAQDARSAALPLSRRLIGTSIRMS